MKPKLLLLWILSTSLAWAQSSAGPLTTGAGSDNSGVGTVAWSNPNNISLGNQSGADSSATSATAGFTNSQISHYLFAQTFGFSLPSNATVVGIVANVYGDAAAGGIPVSENSILSIKGGVAGGTNQAVGGNWPQNGTYSLVDSLPGSGLHNDLWGQTWAYSDINSSTFGIAISVQSTGTGTATAYISTVTVTVYYTVPTPMGVRRPIVMAQTRKAQSIHVHAAD